MLFKWKEVGYPARSEYGLIASCFSLLSLCIGPSLFWGCSSAKPQIEQRRAPTVTVSSAGEKIKNPQSKLVHRITLDRRDLLRIFPVNSPAPNIKMQCRKEFDLRGGVKGLRIVRLSGTSGPETLGLRENDLITAVGTKLVRDPKDLWGVYEGLRVKQQASLTLTRAGRPHKILYYLPDGSASAASQQTAQFGLN